MTDTPTLQRPTQPKQERVNPRDVVGGTLEQFENIFETITGVGQGYTNEGPVAPSSTENFIPTSEFRTKFPTTGEINDFREKRQTVATAQEIISEHAIEQTKYPLTQKRIDVNTKVGGITNVLFEGLVDNQGQVRTDMVHEYEAKSSEMDPEELNERKKLAVVQGRTKKGGSKGAISGAGEVDLNTDHENRNMSGKPA